MRDPLLENYLAFLAAFRGVVREEPHAVSIASDRPDFTMLIASPSAPPELIDACAATVLAVAGDTPIHARLVSSGRQRQGELVFMEKEAEAGSDAAAADVRVARTAAEIEQFTEVQARGFLEEPEEFEDWRPWLGAANQRNRENARCHFLIADGEHAPAAVALLVESLGMCGLYAVATHPDHRRQGLSSRLLAAGEALAARRGYARLGLQVYAETYAHGFYARRGFREQARFGVWAPPDARA